MRQEVELSCLDVRYESYRMRSGVAEERLMGLIAARGIEEPLEGVAVGEQRVLLNGFKRYRCAKRLGIQMVPYLSLGEDEVAGIMNLLRNSNDKSLSILEQASFIDELTSGQQLSVAQVAAELSRSKAWVSVRMGLIGELTPRVRELLFAGAFPVYAYMYSLRQFMRINGVSREEGERFVVAVSGRGLSLREIEYLLYGYFRGPESFRQQVLSGKLTLPLARLKQAPPGAEGCSEYERVFLQDLERIQNCLLRVMGKSRDPRLRSRVFHAQSHLLTAGILSRGSLFLQTIKELHARSGKVQSDLPAAPGRDGAARDCQTPQGQP